MEENRSAPFTVLWIAGCTPGALRRDFFHMLWEEVLCTRPRIETVAMADDDIVILGQPPAYTSLMIDIPRKGRMSGHLELWVDDIKSAAEWLESRRIPFVRTAGAYEGVIISQAYLKEPVEVRLSQAPEQVMVMYRSLRVEVSA